MFPKKNSETNYSILVISLKIIYFEFHNGVSKLTKIKLLRSPLNKTAFFKNQRWKCKLYWELGGNFVTKIIFKKLLLSNWW